MPKPKIFVTRNIPPAGLKLLENYDLRVFPKNRSIKRQELLQGVKGVNAILSLLTEKIDGEVMSLAGKNLKIIANYAAGYDNVDIKEAKKRDIMVTNTPGILTDSVAEHTIALLLSIAKRIPEADRFVRKGKFKGWEPLLLLSSELKGKIIGVIGLGRIGRRVAEIAKRGFGMRVIYYDQFLRSQDYKFAPLKTIFKKSDFISLHVPLTSDSKHLVRKKELKTMKKSAFLINTSRGAVIDEQALVKALQAGWIRGAALDVFEKEPKLALGLKSLKNVVLTPHIASASAEAREKMAIMAAVSIIKALRGEKPETMVF